MTKAKLALLALALAGTLFADTIPGLFNTGVDNANAPLALGAADPHYTLSSSTDLNFPGPNAIVVNATPNWAANTATSQWISVQLSAQGATAGIYTYTTSFSLPPGTNPATAAIAGTWAADDSVVLLLNGTQVASAVAPASGALTSFQIPAGSPFVAGVNTLQFVVANTTGGVTGLQVGALSGTVDPAVAALPVLGIVKTHSAASLTQGGFGAYTIAVTNTGVAPTNGTAVTVTDILTAATGLIVTAMSGVGWTCASLPICTRSDVLAPGLSYPLIAVTVSVAANAASPQVNAASVTGGGTAGTATSAGDSTVILPTPVLSVSLSHAGTFTQGQTAGEWDISVQNAAGAGATSAVVTVTDTLPAGYKVTGYGVNPGWNCTPAPAIVITCASTTVVNGGSSYPAIQLFVSVPATSPVSVTNTAQAFGGGDSAHSSTNPATGSDTVNGVIQTPASITATAGNNQIVKVNSVFPVALQATVLDAANIPIPGISVRFAAPGSGPTGTFPGSANSANVLTGTAGTSLGVATAPTFTAGATPGQFIVRASAGSASTNFTLTNLGYTVSASAGSPQSIPVGTDSAIPLEVTVTDLTGTYQNNLTVTFTAPSVFAILSSATATTDSTGRARVMVSATGAAGSYSVLASVAGGGGLATFVLSNVKTAKASGACQVTSAADDNGAGTLRSQVAACGAGGIITFAPAVTKVTLAQQQDIQLTQDLTIDGGSGVSLDANHQSRILFVTGGNIVLKNLTLANGVAQGGNGGNGAGAGGGAAGMGGAIFMNAGMLTAGNVTFSNNLAQGGTGGGATTGQSGGGAGVGEDGGVGNSLQFGNGGGGGDFGTPGGLSGDGSGGNGAHGLVSGVVGGFGGGSGGIGTSGGGFGGAGGGGSFGGLGGSGVAGGGGAGLGGAIFVRAGTLVLDGAIFNANLAAKGLAGTPGGSNGQGKGGALFIGPAATAISFDPPTFIGDSATEGNSGTTCESALGVGGASDTADICGILLPATITAVSGDGQATTIGTAFPNPLVAAVTAGSNGSPIQGVPVTFAGPASGASTNPASLTAVTGANGLASVNVSANATPGGPYLVTATIGGAATPAIYTLTNRRAAAKLSPNPGTTPQVTLVGQPLGTLLGVTVTDSLNVPVPGITVTFTAPASGPSGTFANGTASTQAVTDQNGVATAAPFFANARAGGPYNVVATAVGPPAVSFALTNVAGQAAQMTPNAGTTPQSASVGTQFARPPSVTVTDAFGNPVPGIEVSFAASAQGGASGTFANGTGVAQAITNANGVASAVLTANMIVGGPYAVTASVVGLPPVNFALTNVAPDLTISKMHLATHFTQGQKDATYVVTVGNAGSAVSAGVVAVKDNIPSGLVLTSMAGAGWICGLPANPNGMCTRTDALAPGGVYPPITVTVTVDPAAPATVTNTATVSGGGEVNTANDLAADPTTINPAPNAVFVNPSAGAGLAQTFRAQYADLNGASDIQVVYLDFGSVPFSPNSCIVAYIQASNTISLFNDASTGLVPGSLAPGGGGTLSNSQCSLSGAGGPIAFGGTNLTVPFAITFATTFTGMQTVFGLAQNYSGSNSGWQTLGTWTPALGVVSVTPVSGSGLSPTFTAVFTDSQGATDLQVVYLQVGGTAGGTENTCFIAYVQASNSLYLFNDNNTAIFGPITPGTSSTLSNSQCTIFANGGQVSAAGANLTVPFAITFQPGFTGLMNVYALAQTYAGAHGGWQLTGTWTPAP